MNTRYSLTTSQSCDVSTSPTRASAAYFQHLPAFESISVKLNNHFTKALSAARARGSGCRRLEGTCGQGPPRIVSPAYQWAEFLRGELVCHPRAPASAAGLVWDRRGPDELTVRAARRRQQPALDKQSRSVSASPEPVLPRDCALTVRVGMAASPLQAITPETLLTGIACHWMGT